VTAAHLRTLVTAAAGHPITFLLAVNVACAALGVAQFAYSLTVLKPQDFAVIGVLAAIGGVVTGLIDFKLSDLTAKLYFAAPKEDRGQRANLLAASLNLHAAAGLIVTALVLCAGILLAPRLLERSTDAWWVAALSVRIGSGYPLMALTLFPRLVGDFYAAGRLRLVTQIVVTLITVAALFAQPDLDGYYVGNLVSAAASLAIGLIVSGRHAGRVLGTPILRLAPPGAAMRAYLGSVSFLTSGWLMGVAKLLTRACDTLLIAALTNDATTGLYRVARQAYDNLAGLTDAVHQFYTPTIVDCVSRNRWEEFGKHRRRLMMIGATVAAGTIAMSWLVLHPLAALNYPQHSAALPAFEILAGLLLVTLGVHGWLWPSLVASNQVRLMSVLTLAGAIAQVSAIWALAAVGHLDQTSAAATSWVPLALAYGPTVFLHHRRRPSVTSSS
jgi:O-antigen/teichoic acid export membrane protein